MLIELAETLAGGLSFVGTFLSLGTTDEDKLQRVNRGVRAFTIIFLLVDVADVTFDFLFASKLRRTNEDGGWGTLLLIFTSVSCLVMLIGKILVQKSLKKEGRDILRVVCMIEFLSYVFEDTTSIMAYAKVDGAFDPGSISDKLNISLSVISGILMACGPSRCGMAWCDVCYLCGSYFKWSEAKAFILDLATIVLVGIAAFFSYVVFHNILGQVAVEGAFATAMTAIYGVCVAGACVSFAGVLDAFGPDVPQYTSWWRGE
mmetsp:Transcript_2219/g.4715  ORF Transcript_2219/g.4715 Transcript_2219/m.4715 type:complete len:260 (+) Transcript_2219:194-973(+)